MSEVQIKIYTLQKFSNIIANYCPAANTIQLSTNTVRQMPLNPFRQCPQRKMGWPAHLLTSLRGETRHPDPR